MSDHTTQGLEARYTVRKIDDPTGKHDDCRYFVLDPQHDPIARQALTYYAMVTPNGDLRRDLNDWLDRLEAERMTPEPPAVETLADPKAPPIDVRTVGDLRASDIGARIIIPDLNVEDATILAVQHFAYNGAVQTDLSVTRWGGMVVSPSIACEVIR